MYAIGGVLLVIALFRLIRGKIKIKAGRSGEKIKRFSGFLKHFNHYLQIRYFKSKYPLSLKEENK